MICRIRFMLPRQWPANCGCYNPRPMKAETGVRFAAVFVVISLFTAYAFIDFPANHEAPTGFLTTRSFMPLDR